MKNPKTKFHRNLFIRSVPLFISKYTKWKIAKRFRKYFAYFTANKYQIVHALISFYLPVLSYARASLQSFAFSIADIYVHHLSAKQLYKIYAFDFCFHLVMPLALAATMAMTFAEADAKAEAEAEAEAVRNGATDGAGDGENALIAVRANS